MDGESYNMANLSQFLGGGAGQDDDPRKEGSPLYCMYGGDFNSQGFDAVVRDSTSHQTVSSPWGAVHNTTASYNYGMLSSTQAYGYNGDAGQLQSQFSSNAYGAWTQYTQSLYQNDQYPHFQYGSCSSTGRITWLSVHSNMGSGMAHATLVNNTSMPVGTRPRRLYSVYNTTFSWRRNSHVASQNGGHHIIDKVNLTTVPGVSRVNGYGNNTGMVTYNERTKTLVVVWGAGSQTADVIVFKGTKNLNKVAVLSDYFDNCTVKNFSVSSISPANISSINYANVMTMDDGDRLMIHWKYSNNAYLYYVDLSGAEGSISASQVSNDGQTTSYGPEQGLMYRPKMQTTWDHKWVAMYSPYYYYGGGIMVYFVSTEDCRRWFKANYTGSNGGGAIFPSGRTGFWYGYGDNKDSTGLHMMSWDFTKTDTTGTGSTVYGFSTNASGTSLTSINNQASLSTSAQYVLPSYYYSTNYPRYATVNWWPKDNNTGGDMFASEYTGA